jgi:hypothetical protein
VGTGGTTPAGAATAVSTAAATIATTAATTSSSGDHLGHWTCRRERSALKGESCADRQGQNTCQHTAADTYEDFHFCTAAVFWISAQPSSQQVMLIRPSSPK